MTDNTDANWIPLTSSTIEAMRYTPDTGVLEIRFKSGGTYSYADVPQEIASGLAEADSPGKYHHANIKGAYAVTKQDQVDGAA